MPELDLLRRIAPEATAPSADAYVRARAAMLERIEPAARRPAQRSRRRWVLPAAGLAATAAATAAVFLSVGTGGEGVASAASVLRDAAATALEQEPAATLGPDQYLYTRSTNAYLTTVVNGDGQDEQYSALVPNDREIWLARDGTGWLHQTSGEPVFLSERDREAWIAAGRMDLQGAMNLPLENNDVPDVPMRSLDLPSDPDALYERLKTDAGDAGTSLENEMFVLVGDALRELHTTPEQRAGLFEVAARIPGVELVGEVEDPVGRAGIAVAKRDETNKIRHTLIFDPETSALLAEEEVVLDGNWAGYAAGTVIGWAAYLESTVVDEVRTRPGGSTVSDKLRG